MSIVPKETIEVISQSIGINNLSPDAALALAPDVEYRMREIMQEAIKCMHHSRRTVLTTDDVDSALTLRNVEPIYGFASGDSLRFKRAVGHMDLFYVDDKELELKDVIEAPLPKAPLDTSLVCHWLAIEGVQPAIPENAHAEVILGPLDHKKAEEKEDDLPVDIRLPVKHILSRELQLYFDKITELVVTKPDSVLFKDTLVSLATDSGLHPLVPYFTCFIADEVSRGLNNFPLLFALMRLVGSLLQNPHIRIEPYLHQLMPSVVTCLVAKRLGNRVADSHWELRDFTANLVASICKRFGHVYSNLQTRLTKTLVHAFLDPKRSLTQHYGAIQGLSALGPNVVRLLLLPNLNAYMKLLKPEMLIENQKNVMKRYEAWRVHGALLHAAGRCIYDLLKLFPQLPSPPSNTILKTNGRVNTTPPNKRKASTELREEQPPLKIIATDGPIAVSQNNLVPSNSHGEPADKSGDSNVAQISTDDPMVVSQNNLLPSNSHGEPADTSGDSSVAQIATDGPTVVLQNNLEPKNSHREPADISGGSNVAQIATEDPMVLVPSNSHGEPADISGDSNVAQISTDDPMVVSQNNLVPSNSNGEPVDISEDFSVAQIATDGPMVVSLNNLEPSNSHREPANISGDSNVAKIATDDPMVVSQNNLVPSNSHIEPTAISGDSSVAQIATDDLIVVSLNNLEPSNSHREPTDISGDSNVAKIATDDPMVVLQNNLVPSNSHREPADISEDSNVAKIATDDSMVVSLNNLEPSNSPREPADISEDSNVAQIATDDPMVVSLNNLVPSNSHREPADISGDSNVAQIATDGPMVVSQNNLVPSNSRGEPADISVDFNVAQIATDGPMVVSQNNLVFSNSHGQPADISGDSNVAKLATDGAMVVSRNNLVPSNNHEEPTDISRDFNVAQSSRQSIAQSKFREGKSGGQGSKVGAIIDQIWKDDLDSGRLLVSLYELFGEPILNYVPNPEMSVFL